MPIIRLLLKGPLIVGLIVLYLCCAAVCALLIREDLRRRRVVVWLGHQLAHAWVYLFNIHIQFKGPDPQTNKRYLLLSNHLSYMDIPLIFTKFPSAFVTSIEVKNTPVLGHFCRLSSCIFVERRKKSQLKDEIAVLRHNIDAGISICLFPEGTSTNGAHVAPFRRSLLEAVVDSQVQVLPLCINYRAIDGIRVTESNRDMICWYGDMGFLRHFVALLSTHRIDVDVSLGEAFVAGAGLDRKKIADRAYEAISSMHLCTSL